MPGTRLVRPIRLGPIATALLLGAGGAAAPAFELRPPTLAAYDRYVAATERRLESERSGAQPFLWLDQQPPDAKARLMARLTAGEVVVDRLQTRENGRAIEVPDGLIHHWIGTVWIPGVTLDRLVAFVQDYDRYPQIFTPMIPRTRVIQREGDRFVVSMRTSVKKVITVVMDGDYTIEYHRLSPTRLWTTNIAANLFQIHEPGTASERREPGDAASGYLWRFRMYCAFEARDGGSLEQCESLTLTRSIPFGVGWIVRPFVTGIPRDTISFTLGQVRAGLVK